jgi:PA domain
MYLIYFVSQFCNTSSLDPEKVKGKIVVCILRGSIPRIVPGITVRDAGGAGMVLVSNIDWGSLLFPDPHVLPATMITFKDALTLVSYMNSTM